MSQKPSFDNKRRAAEHIVHRSFSRCCKAEKNISLVRKSLLVIFHGAKLIRIGRLCKDGDSGRFPCASKNTEADLIGCEDLRIGRERLNLRGGNAEVRE